VGIALASRLRGDNATIFAIIGDGESQEGQIWEAAMYAGNQKLNRLIAFTDYNDLQIDGNVSQVNDVAPLEDKWRAFKWHTIVVDGHDVQALDSAIQSAKGQDKPTMIIARTIKGKGVSFVVSKGAGNHNMPFSKEDAQTALEELRRDL
jgi:transketolase